VEKLDYKKEYKDLYLPGTKPVLIQVPKIAFIMVDGRGDPNLPDGEYSRAMEVLYALTYTIKMSKMGGRAPKGYFEYVVPPLEGLWWYEDGGGFDLKKSKSQFCWTSMIRQPEFVTPELFAAACEAAAKKKPGLDLSKARFSEFEEGLCVQCMHIGHYDAEPETVEKMDSFVNENGYVCDLSDTRRHHEIYLGDPRKGDPEKMKTVIRHPVRKQEV
jgi:hypothetical protein